MGSIIRRSVPDSRAGPLGSLRELPGSVIQVGHTWGIGLALFLESYFMGSYKMPGLSSGGFPRQLQHRGAEPTFAEGPRLAEACIT